MITSQPVAVPPAMSAELGELVQAMLVKQPEQRITLAQIKEVSGLGCAVIYTAVQNRWVTGYGVYPMLDTEDNCTLVEVTEDDVENSVRSIPHLDTFILVKPHKKMSF